MNFVRLELANLVPRSSTRLELAWLALNQNFEFNNKHQPPGSGCFQDVATLNFLWVRTKKENRALSGKIRQQISCT